MATVIRAVKVFSVSTCIAPRSRTTHQPSRVITPSAPFRLPPSPPFSLISEFERELIHARMTEGRKRAVAKGVKFGPKFKLNSFQRQ